MIGAVLITTGGAGAFLLTTVLMDRMPDAALVALPLLFATLLVVGLCGLAAARAATKADPKVALTAAIGGAMAFWAAPLLTLSQRATDAPPGTEVLFLTSSCWAFLVATAVVLAGKRTWPLAVMAGATTALAGSAGLLASWERPSSFSPFVRYTEQELLMLAAGVIFAAGTLLLWAALKAAPFRAVAVIGMGGASIAAVLGMLVQPPSLGVVSFSVVPLLLLGLAQSALAWGWFSVTDRRGPVIAASALFLVPAALTTLSAVERATGVYGSNPILWPAALAAIAITLTGCVAMAIPLLRSVPAEPRPTLAALVADATRGTRAMFVLCGLSLVAAVVALVTPALAASSRGIGADGANFAADWIMVGAESAAGWVAFGAALLASATVSASVVRKDAGIARILAAATVVVSGGALMLLGTALHTLTRWIPAEVQQAYGTEYARMSVEPVVSPAMYASLGLSAAVALLVFLSAARTPERDDIITEEVS